MNQKKLFLFDSDSLKNFHKRIFFSIFVFIFIFGSAFYRISSISVSSFFEDTSEILKKNIFTRGNIYDRNGNILAASVNSKSLSARPKSIENIDILSLKLEKILNIDQKILKKNYLVIKILFG